MLTRVAEHYIAAAASDARVPLMPGEIAEATRRGVDAVLETFSPWQLGRLVTPVEVGRVVSFLLSEAAVIIRGQAINVDGGATPY